MRRRMTDPAGAEAGYSPTAAKTGVELGSAGGDGGDGGGGVVVVAAAAAAAVMTGEYAAAAEAAGVGCAGRVVAVGEVC
jgi:hypothetical protein